MKFKISSVSDKTPKKAGRPPAIMNFVDKPSKTLLTLGQKIDKHQHSPELLDQSRNIARFSAFLDVMEGRAESFDCPQFRQKLKAMFENGEHPRKIKEYVDRGVEEDNAWRQLLGLAERQANMQSRAAELILRSDTSLSARQVLSIFSNFMKIVAQEVSKEVARKIMVRCTREVMGINPEIGIFEQKALEKPENE